MNQQINFQSKLGEFFRLHGHRVNVYLKFHTIFKTYCEDLNTVQYDELVKGEIIPQFSEISSKVIEIETWFAQNNQPQLAKLVRSIQVNEKEKLQLTIQEQLLKKQIIIDKNSDPQLAVQLKENTLKMQTVIDELNDLCYDLKDFQDE